MRVAPKHGYCPDCDEPIHNKGAHAEACTGPNAVMVFPYPQLLTMIEEEEETVRHLDYELAVHRSRLAWLKAVKEGRLTP